MTTVGVYNLKGGVGKTTSSVNLAYLAAADGLKTLLWDLDPQGAASYYLRADMQPDTNARRIVKGKDDIKSVISKTNYKKLRIIPADFEFRNIDITLDDMKKSRSRINDALKPLRDEFDLVVLDSPPGISLLSENIFKASDFLLVPVIPSTLSLRTLEQIGRFYEENELDKSRIIPFVSMSQERKKLHQSSMDALKSEHPNLCASRIPFSSEIEKMGVTRKPVNSGSQKSKSAAAYLSLWREIAGKIGIDIVEPVQPGVEFSASTLPEKNQAPGAFQSNAE